MRPFGILPGLFEASGGAAVQAAVPPVRVLPVLFGLLLRVSAAIAIEDVALTKSAGKEILPWH